MAKAADRKLDNVASFTRTGAAGDVIFSEGDAGAELFIVQAGRIELLRGAAPAGVIDPGGVFGEWSFFEQQPRDVTARALSAFEVIALDRATFQQITDEAPEIAQHMLHKLARALHDRRLVAPTRTGAARASAAESPSVAAVVPAPADVAAPAPPKPKPTGDAQLVEAASGTTFTLAADESHVGRIDRSTGFTPQVDLTKLDTDRTIGRRHAKILKRGGAYFVQDANSRNGTFVNGQRIAGGADIELRDGDEVRFGLVKTTFQWR